jgi:hypothetical protein
LVEFVSAEASQVAKESLSDKQNPILNKLLVLDYWQKVATDETTVDPSKVLFVPYYNLK